MAEKHSKCRLCGERHRLGHCPKGFSVRATKGGRDLASIAPRPRPGAVPERKRESDAAKKAGGTLRQAAKGMKARAGRVAGGRTPAKGAGAKASAPKVKAGEVRRGRPRIGEEKKTIAARKPWLALKMSERTWWRRQAEKRA